MALSKHSRFALFTTVFLSCVSFAIVMPSLWPYLESIDSSKHFLAYVVAIYSIGEALGALYFGHTTQYETTRTTLNKSAAAGTFGALLYVTAALLPFPQWCVFVSRFFMGFMTGGSQAVQQVYLADVLPESQLTATTVTLNAYACLGFVIGPAFGLLTGFIPNFSAWGLQFNQLTAPGYFVFASGIVCLALYTFVLDEEGDRASGKSPESSTEDAPLYETSVSCEAVVDMEEASSLLGNGDAMPGKMPMEADMAALVVCNIAFFIHFYGFALQETITTPLVQEYYNWSVFTANSLFTFAGICALLAFIFVSFAARTISDRNLAQASLVLGAIGYVFLISTPKAHLPIPQFLLGFAIISIAFPMGRACVISLYTKLLPMRLQGTGQGIILAVGAVARIVGPFWAVRAFYMTWGAAIVFGATAIGFAACVALMASFYGRLGT